MEPHAIIDWFSNIGAMAPDDWIEFSGTTLGVLCVLCYIKESVWSWPTGLVQTVLYTWIFYNAELYSDFILQLINIVLVIYGWYYWVHPPVNKMELPITRMKLREAGAWAGVTIVGTVVVGYLMKNFAGAALPYWDAAIAIMSLIAQYLIARKVLENWVIWIIVDVVAIGVYFAKDLRLTSGLYAVFLVMATLGFLAWRKSYLATPSEKICESCQYDLRGNPQAAACPECGALITPVVQATA